MSLSGVFLVFLIVAINIACYYRCLSGYFLADDFVHIPYLVHVFQGHGKLLLEPFYSNWMHAAGTQFYRPLISVSLALDYLIWGVNASGYHASNIVWQTLASIFLFLFARRLLSSGNSTDNRAGNVAFFAAALFAACPLHTEVVSWVIGRVDSVCTAFYLASFWLFLKAAQEKNKAAWAASLVCFASSLASKEMAISLPAAIALFCLLKPPPGLTRPQRALHIWRQSWAYWVLLFLYLLVRTMALGTITGGYSGSVGAGLSSSFLARFFQGSTWLKVLFPFNGEQFNPGSAAERNLKVLYALILLGLALRVPTRMFTRAAAGTLLFAGLWFVLAIAPTYQVFNLSDTLFGSRFLYLATAPLSLFLSAMIYPPELPDRTQAKLPEWLKSTLPIWTTRLAICVLTGLVVCISTITYRNNLSWVQAGERVRALKNSIESELAILPPEKKLAILNIPQRYKGAHMIYNAAMLTVLLSPPLSGQYLADRVVTFEPVNYGEPDLIIASRARQLIAQPQLYIFYAWDGSQRKLVPLHLVPSKQQLISSVSLPAGKDNQAANHNYNHYMLSPVFSIPSTASDFLDLYLSCRPASASSCHAPPVVIVSWAGANEILPCQADRRLVMPLKADGKMRRCRFYVSEHKCWLASEEIKRLAVELSPGFEYRLDRLELLAGGNEIPILTGDPLSLKQAPDGVSYMSGSRCSFIYDASQIPGIKEVVLELSKPNSWFEHYSGTYRDQVLCPQALQHWHVAGVKGRFTLAARVFPAAGYYQIRIAGLDSRKNLTGYASDPINMQVSQDQITSSDRREILLHAE